MKIYYEELYRMVSHPECFVADCWVDKIGLWSFVEPFLVKNFKDGYFSTMNFNTLL
jgi:hypothetical protein